MPARHALYCLQFRFGSCIAACNAGTAGSMAFNAVALQLQSLQSHLAMPSTPAPHPPVPAHDPPGPSLPTIPGSQLRSPVW